MPPRRRAFRSNDFVKLTTIPRDAKCQAEPPFRRGTHSHQNHFHCNPSRKLVEPRIRFAASNPQPRLNVLPRRDFPAHAPIPGVKARGTSALTPGYQALAPNGAAQGKKYKLLSLLSRRDTILLTPHKRNEVECSVGMDGGTHTLSRRGSRHPRCLKFARREREALEKKRCLESCYHRPCTIGYITT